MKHLNTTLNNYMMMQHDMELECVSIGKQKNICILDSTADTDTKMEMIVHRITTQVL